MTREELVEIYGEENVWDTSELRETFKVISFLAPFTYVERKVDGKKGLVQFNHYPRFYFDFQEE